MRFIFATVFTAILATPAAAQYYVSGYDWLGRPIVTETQTITVQKARRGMGAYAQVPRTERHSLNPVNDVYVNGVYIGSDPDWRIRETLRREFLSESSIR